MLHLREQMAHDLQREGPLCLQSLGENDLLQLVDLLISKKKWVEECSTEEFPFKLSQVGKSENVSREEASPFTKAKLPVRSRDEVLADCEKLVNEMLKEKPKGFFVGFFRKHFLERYGYYLDLQKLGFEKLASLLKTMPGVKIESGYVVPADDTPNIKSLESTVPGKQENISHTIASDSELPDSSEKGDDFDSLWEDLGPVASTKSTNSKLRSVSRKSAVESVEKQMKFDYEPALSDDESSDSGETSPVIGVGGQRKASEEDGSSLLQILDTWYISKGGDSCKKLENANPLLDFSLNKVKSSDSSEVGAKSETSIKSQVKKQKPQKSYSFVADPVTNDNNEKLVDGILGNLRKSNESSKNAGAKVLCE